MTTPTDRTAAQHAVMRGEDPGDDWRNDPHVAHLAERAERDEPRAPGISRRFYSYP